MPHYVSKDGKWYPRKEKVALVNRRKDTLVLNEGKENEQVVNSGDPFIYEGVDRAAAFELYDAGVETFGEDFRHNTEFLQGIRNMGFDSVEKYLKFIGYDKKKVEEKFDKEAMVVNKHELPETVKMIGIMGGGRDFSGGGKDLSGGFGKQPDVR